MTLAMTTFRDVQIDLSGLAYALALAVLGVRSYRGDRLALAALALLSFAWFGIDTLWEGPTLLRFNAHHGMTAADPIGVAGLGFAAWIWFRDRR